MKESDAKIVAEIITMRTKYEEALAILSGGTLPIETPLGTVRLTIGRHSILRFLKEEIQAFNLQLHNLGVELPGVATIGGAQSVTKGQDV